jgi:hypothetical protein
MFLSNDTANDVLNPVSKVNNIGAGTAHIRVL